MFTRLVALTAAAAISLTAGSAWAQTGKQPEKKAALSTGSAAPAISTDKWIKGDEVKKFESGKVYVVEFWATWCGPCIKSIPHLTELQKNHKDVTFIGVAGAEKGDKDKQVKGVEKFVKEQGSKMDYRVAYDGDDSMWKSWMEPAGQGGIPCAFIIGADNKIAWIGHPSGMDKPLEEAIKKAPKKSTMAFPTFDPNFSTFAFQQDAGKDAKKDDKKDEKKEAAKTEALKVGDKAPAITVSKFVKGDPITGFEKGQVYVMEFWATWCGPCIASMPHITKVQKDYKDKGVKVLGVSVWENDQAKVEPFVKDKGDGMGYTVAMDDVPAGKKGNDGKMAKTWMEAAGRNGIPTTFIVDKEGKIAWIGHPMQMDRPLKDIVAGTFDPKKEAEQARKAEAEAKNFAKYRKALSGGNTEEAYKLTDGLLAAYNDDAEALNEIAWLIVDPEAGIKDKNLEVAMKAAKRADEISEHKNAAILDTLARVHFCKGEFDKAIEVETKAIDLADAQMKNQLKEALEEYQAAKKGK